MSGILLKYAWACLEAGCMESGDGPTSDKTAEKHTKAFGHGTHSWAKPEVRDGTTTDADGDSGRSPGAVPGEVREVRAASAEGSPAPPPT